MRGVKPRATHTGSRARPTGSGVSFTVGVVRVWACGLIGRTRLTRGPTHYPPRKVVRMLLPTL